MRGLLRRESYTEKRELSADLVKKNQISPVIPLTVVPTKRPAHGGPNVSRETMGYPSPKIASFRSW